ncbi:MAG: glycosyltransferase [Moorea sp. SIO4A3]|nr:glycosyltransferase [Moorena sp. SIO4A3]
MKILYLTTGVSIGGAELMLYHLLSKINRNRFSPVVLSLMGRDTLGDRIESLGIPVEHIGLEPGKVPSLKALSSLINTVNTLKPDLIQGWMYHGNIAAKLASSFYNHKIPLLWSIHHSIYSLSYENKMTASLIKSGAIISKFIQGICFVSNQSKLQHEALGYSSQNSCVIPNGFDTSLFKPSLEARAAFRSELGLSEQSVLIGLIGRYHPMKDHPNFIRAASLLVKEFPDVHFIMVGTEVDQDNNFLSSLIQDLGLSNHIHLLGERSDIPRVTAALDINTLASAYGEAFPLVIGEAMSSCVPCVVTDVGDSAWIVGNTGRVVPPRNSETLARAWKELILIGNEGRKALGKAARSRIIDSFSINSVVAQYESLYELILA